MIFGERPERPEGGDDRGGREDRGGDDRGPRRDFREGGSRGSSRGSGPRRDERRGDDRGGRRSFGGPRRDSRSRSGGRAPFDNMRPNNDRDRR